MVPQLVGVRLIGAVRCDGLRVLEVDHAVVEGLHCDGSNSSGDDGDARRTAGESGGEGDQDTAMVLAGSEAFGREPYEVAHVFGEHRVAADRAGLEHSSIRASRQTQLRDRYHLEVVTVQGVGQSRRIHLVEEQPHRAGASVLSLWCNAIRASISSGNADR